MQTLPRAVVLAPARDLLSNLIGLIGVPHHILGPWERRGEGFTRIKLRNDRGAVLIEGNITLTPWDNLWPDESEDDESGGPEVHIEKFDLYMASAAP